MAAPGKLAPQRDGRKGVTGVAEGGEQQAASAQSISASWRIVRLRDSTSSAIADTISVPTPAAR